MAFAPKTRLSTDQLLHSEVACNDVMVRKLSAMAAVLELACRRPELKDELLKPFLEESVLDMVPGYTETCNQLNNDPNETRLSNNPWDQLPPAFRPPPGLEDVVPMSAMVKPLGHSFAAHESDVVATATMAVDAPVGMQQQKKRQEEARSRTLVLAYLPRSPAAASMLQIMVPSGMEPRGNTLPTVMPAFLPQ